MQQLHGCLPGPWRRDENDTSTSSAKGPSPQAATQWFHLSIFSLVWDWSKDMLACAVFMGSRTSKDCKGNHSLKIMFRYFCYGNKIQATGSLQGNGHFQESVLLQGVSGTVGKTGGSQNTGGEVIIHFIIRLGDHCQSFWFYIPFYACLLHTFCLQNSPNTSNLPFIYLFSINKVFSPLLFMAINMMSHLVTAFFQTDIFLI